MSAHDNHDDDNDGFEFDDADDKERLDEKIASMKNFSKMIGIKFAWRDVAIEDLESEPLKRVFALKQIMEPGKKPSGKLSIVNIELPELALRTLINAATIGVAAAKEAGLDVPVTEIGVEQTLMDLYDSEKTATVDLSMATMISGSIAVNMYDHAADEHVAEFVASLDEIPTFDGGEPS